MPVPDDMTELARAYTETFTTAYGSLVLRDLATMCGALAVLPEDASHDELVAHNARQALFGKVIEALAVSPAGREAISGAIMPRRSQQETNT